MQCSSSISNGWLIFRGETFSIEYPEGWTVKPQEDGLIRVISKESQAVIWPYFIAIRINSLQAKDQLQTLAQKTLPGYSWNNVSTVGNNSIRLQGISKEGKLAICFLN
jgi:hypothetical protein